MALPNLPRLLLPKVEAGASSAYPPSDGRRSPAGESARKRRCISNACLPCRKRKSKCDGVKPSCNACTSVYCTSCYYDLDGDQRRKGALKRDIRLLKEESEKRDIILESIRTGPEADVDDIIQLVRANPDESYQSIAESVQKMLVNSKRKHEAPSLEGELAVFSGKSSIEETRQTRHYGHTSILALEGSEDDIPSVAEGQFGTWTSVTNDKDLIQHLLRVYFTWSHPYYTLFSEEAFYHGLNGKQRKYCSPMLVNAVLALGCLSSDRPGARADPNDPATVGAHFFAEARRLLAEDDRSCLTTVQTLGAMSLRQAMIGDDSAGWKYAGQMMAMSIELGLHMPYKQPSVNVTATEIEVRRITFWGCYVLATAWAVCVGRISLLPRTAIKLEKPVLRENLEKKIWKPYSDPPYLHDPSGQEQPCHTYNFQRQIAFLAEIIDDTIQMYYAPRDRLTSRRLQNQHEKFQKWYKELPAAITIKENGSTLPQVISLHVYYHSCIILFFRAFLRVSFVQNTKSPRQICTESAIAISQLVGLYSRTYGLRRSFFILTYATMTAAIIHLVNISSQNPTPMGAGQAAGYLADTIRMLNEMKAFPILLRFINMVRMLVSKWLTVIPEQVQEALDECDLPSTVFSSSNSHITPSLVPDSNSSTDAGIPSPPPPELPGYHKPSIPEFVEINTVSNMGNGSSTTNQNLFWSPFPETLLGVPIAPPESTSNPNMDISSMLASSVDGDWPELSRDGFRMLDDGFGAGGQLWAYNWNQGM